MGKMKGIDPRQMTPVIDHQRCTIGAARPFTARCLPNIFRRSILL